MKKSDRHLAILSYMKRNSQKADIDELAVLFQVTGETIRKDFIELENQHLIRRVLGGAVLPEIHAETPFNRRYEEHLDLKTEIAVIASRFIEERDFISMDSGTTNYCLAKSFPKKKVSILTNSLDIATELIHKDNIRVFIAGGELREQNMSMTGENAEKAICNYRVRKCFLTAEGIGLDGIMDGHESEARIKKTMLEHADEKYLLVDHTKFSVLTPIVISSPQNLTAILTDSQIDPAIVRQYADHNIRIISS